MQLPPFLSQVPSTGREKCKAARFKSLVGRNTKHQVTLETCSLHLHQADEVTGPLLLHRTLASSAGYYCWCCTVGHYETLPFAIKPQYTAVLTMSLSVCDVCDIHYTGYFMWFTWNRNVLSPVYREGSIEGEWLNHVPTITQLGTWVRQLDSSTFEKLKRR